MTLLSGNHGSLEIRGYYLNDYDNMDFTLKLKNI